jgi:NAD(P)-dependent dehydrogenase (short-subunit alcohol dehydrogenase family)
LSSFRSALVTGGRSGIGAAIVAALEREGTEVQVLDVVDGFDVADPAAWDAVGAVDLACLNAGVVTGEGLIGRVSDEQYRRILGVNVDGVVFGVRRLARVMHHGSIVVTASLAGLVGTEGDPLYALTKHALVGFVRSVAPQLEARGIRINMVNPGIVDTPLLGPEGLAELEESGFPLLRPDDVAKAVLLAARDEEVGQAWVVQPGREPLKFRYPGVPGPRVPGKEGMVPRL